MLFDQAEYDLRCEWGEQGVVQLAPISDVIVIVDVLSFSTCVEIATNNHATVFPYRFKDDSVVEYARSLNAVLASRDRSTGYSLSPNSLLTISKGTRLVLPSPNGATLTLSSGNTPTIAGCLRNCAAVARHAQSLGSRISVIPAGERWEADGSLRPAWEDWVGAGAILSFLDGKFSPEAEAAIVAFEFVKDRISDYLTRCSSGKELIARGFSKDVELSGALNASQCVPTLTNGGYTRYIEDSISID